MVVVIETSKIKAAKSESKWIARKCSGLMGVGREMLAHHIGRLW